MIIKVIRVKLSYIESTSERSYQSLDEMPRFSVRTVLYVPVVTIAFSQPRRAMSGSIPVRDDGSGGCIKSEAEALG